MKCGIVKDLLPLYIDNLTCEDSNDAIEEHIKECNNCSQEVELLTAGLQLNKVVESALEESMEERVIKRIKKRMLLIKILFLIAGTAMGLYITRFVDHFQFILIFPIIGVVGEIFFKKIWITPLVIWLSTVIISSMFTRQWIDIPMFILIATVYAILAIIGSLISYGFRRALEK